MSFMKNNSGSGAGVKNASSFKSSTKSDMLRKPPKKAPSNHVPKQDPLKHLESIIPIKPPKTEATAN